MDIVWKENPLATSVVLTPEEKEALGLKARLRWHGSVVRSAMFHLDADGRFKKFYDPARARELLEATQAEDFAADVAEDLVEELERGEHCGDCTCVASPCSKCLAEEMLGINTIEELGRHAGSVLASEFRKGGSVDQVLARLAAYRPVPVGKWASSPEEFAAHATRWLGAVMEARSWLERYRDLHFAAVEGESGDAEVERKDDVA